MNYSKEEFMKKYDEWFDCKMDLNRSLANSGPVDYQKRNRLNQLYDNLCKYGVGLLKQNPNDREIACIVYSAFELQAPSLYEYLSDELKNDKLVTMLAIKKFDMKACEQVGERLKSDKEVMYLLLKHTSGLIGITKFAPELLIDESFWKEIFASRCICLASEVGNQFGQVYYDIAKLNEKYRLGINMSMIYGDFSRAMEHPSVNSNLDVMGLYNSNWTNNPHLVDEMVKGHVDVINNYVVDSELKEELLGNLEVSKSK